MRTEYRVTYGGCGRIAAVEEIWTSASAACLCAAERVEEGHAGVRISKREISDWQPIECGGNIGEYTRQSDH